MLKYLENGENLLKPCQDVLSNIQNFPDAIDALTDIRYNSSPYNSLQLILDFC